MRRAGRRLTACSLALGLVLALSAAVSAQEDSTAIAEIIRVDVAPDQQAAFEEGVKSHLDVLAEEGLDWEWHAWEVVTGKHAGSYYVGTFGHAWSDFDQTPVEDPAAAEESFRQNIAPNIKSSHPGYWKVHADLTRQDPEAGEGPPALSTVAFYKLEPGQSEAFTNAVQRVKQAADDADYSEAYWTVYELEYGGGPVWAIGSGASNWAELAEPESTLGEVFEEAVGDFEADAVFERFTGAIASSHSEILRYREDLSYLPGSGGM